MCVASDQDVDIQLPLQQRQRGLNAGGKQRVGARTRALTLSPQGTTWWPCVTPMRNAPTVTTLFSG